jgi:metal-sulfur cluster biosynthetic enzyme
MVTEDAVYGALKKCYDPEIPVNIVDLGLVYNVAVQGEKVEVVMTLTYPGCGMAQQITDNAKGQVAALPGVKEAEVKLVFEPAWNQTMISPEGRQVLGME